MRVARARRMARRIAALLGMLILVGLVLVLVWRVYVHHEQMSAPEEPTVVALPVRAA